MSRLYHSWSFPSFRKSISPIDLPATPGTPFLKPFQRPTTKAQSPALFLISTARSPATGFRYTAFLGFCTWTPHEKDDLKLQNTNTDVIYSYVLISMLMVQKELQKERERCRESEKWSQNDKGLQTCVGRGRVSDPTRWATAAILSW